MRTILLSLAAIVLGVFPAVAHADHAPGHGYPNQGPADVEFAEDFEPPLDVEHGYPIGGFGGIARGVAVQRLPVILVHGNTESHEFWQAAENPPTVVNVRQRLLDAGYTEQEVWALSYDGATGCGGTGCGTANDVNVADLANFIDAVLDYTGAEGFDVVAHSLGVTIVRRTLVERPDLFALADDLVLVAGANHGTTVCRGIESVWWGCDEIAPGSAWLEDLNGDDETPTGPTYTTIYDGSGVADYFFVNGPGFDDSQSPRLEGADNIELPNTAHYTLARGEEAFAIYLPILDDPLPGAGTVGGDPSAAPTAPAPGPVADDDLPATGGGAALAAVALGVLARRRRG